MTIRWKAVEKYFTVVLFSFHFYIVCCFGKFISFAPSTVRSERVKIQTLLFSLLLFGRRLVVVVTGYYTVNHRQQITIIDISQKDNYCPIKLPIKKCTRASH